LLKPFGAAKKDSTCLIRSVLGAPPSAGSFSQNDGGHEKRDRAFRLDGEERWP